MLKWLLSPNPIGRGESAEIERIDDALTRDVATLLARAGVATFHRTLPRLRAEFDRARRYGRPLTLALVGDARTGSTDLAPRHGARSPLDPGSPLIPVVIAPVLAEVTRTIDVVTYASTLAQCVIAMPEADAAQARHALSRMARLCTERLNVPVTVRTATFPENGLTLEELLRSAAAALDTNVAPAPATPVHVTQRATA